PDRRQRRTRVRAVPGPRPGQRRRAKDFGRTPDARCLRIRGRPGGPRGTHATTGRRAAGCTRRHPLTSRHSVGGMATTISRRALLLAAAGATLTAAAGTGYLVE